MTLFAALPLAFAAGVLKILSPCVLPLAPIVVAGGRAKGVGGPLALAAGLALSFGIVGGGLASVGVEFGDSIWLRAISGALMLVIGAALLAPRLGYALEMRLAPVGGAADGLRSRLPQAGLLGEGASAAGRIAFGALLAIVGLAVLTGLDHHIETGLISAMPDWLTSFATTL